MIIHRSDGVLYLKKNIKSLVWFQLYYLFFYGFFRDIVGLPGFIAYFLDLFNILLFLYTIIKGKIWKVQKGQYRVAFFWILFFFIVTFYGLLFVEGSFVLYIWGFRNTFRYYIFFISCAILLDLSDIYGIVDVFKRVYLINLVICTIELMMGYRGDYLGGVFGVQQGCNGYLNLFLVILSAIYITEYLEKRNGLIKTVLFILSGFYLMSIAELKAFLFELPIIILLGMINAKFSFRKIALIMIGVVGIAVGVSMLGYFFEESGLSFFTTDAITNYMGDRGYTSSGDLSRINAVFQLHERFLSSSRGNELFGIGLGNASYSGMFSFFNSNFYMLYNALHYQWFTDALIYIETGLIGLIFFEGFFVIIFIFSKSAVKRLEMLSNKIPNSTDNKLKTAIQTSGIVAIICIIISVYNSSLSMDSAYMVYFLMAVPVIIDLRLNKLTKDSFNYTQELEDRI